MYNIKNVCGRCKSDNVEVINVIEDEMYIDDLLLPIINITFICIDCLLTHKQRLVLLRKELIK